MDQMLPRPATPDEALLMQQNTMLFQESCVRSQNEQALYAAWENAVEENSNLNTLITTFQAQMQELRSEIAGLTRENVRVEQQEPANVEYYTDEEELAKETEWIVQHKRNATKKKPILPATSRHNQPQNNINSNPNVKRLNFRNLPDNNLPGTRL